ncbi:deoxyribose-phosphate aldolase [Amaricoccus macauensis]|uniref:deoxyribose-phosphate aldolase n=1 Tax=Amaricoccus macauensis TaxID=57001 RepID=UPI003C7D0D05
MSASSELETTARRAIVCLDLTNLEDNCTEADVDTLCKRAQTREGSVAAVCVWPRFVAQASGALKGTGVHVATVVNFPSGAEPIEDVKLVTEKALEAGADEIDLVIPYRALMDGDPEAVERCVADVRKVCGSAPLKAILETGELKDAALIRDAAERALRGGADYLKTSTGKVSVNATPEAAEIMLHAIKTSGSSAGLKVSGGIRTTEDAKTYFAICDDLMGGSWAGPRNFRIGASGLLDALLETLGGSSAELNEDSY